MHKFGHSPTFDQQNGRVKVYCSCGAQSERLDKFAEAQEAYEAHMTEVGLRERKVRMK